MYREKEPQGGILRRVYRFQAQLSLSIYEHIYRLQ